MARGPFPGEGRGLFDWRNENGNILFEPNRPITSAETTIMMVRLYDIFQK